MVVKRKACCSHLEILAPLQPLNGHRNCLRKYRLGSRLPLGTIICDNRYVDAMRQSDIACRFLGMTTSKLSGHIMDIEIERTEYLPSYLGLYEKGVLAARAQELVRRLASCDLCPRRCGVDRRAGHVGACGVGARPKVAAMSIHPWEEPPISGTGGSGTIFFSGCTLNCVFCQNYPISQLGVGRTMGIEELAAGMLRLQNKGAHNINLVTSTHQMAAVVEALLLAIPRGLRLPIVYNSSGYENVEILRLLEGIVDIFLPDIKYSDDDAARFCSRRSDYVEHNRMALLEMWRQGGALRVNDESVAYRGLLIRHLVLPRNLSGTRSSLAFLADRMGTDTWISLMNQYFPAHKAHGLSPLDRKVTREEYEEAFKALDDFGFNNGFVQTYPDDENDLPR